MPYDGEFAQYKPLHRIVESERVKELLGGYRIRAREQNENSPHALTISDERPSEWTPDWVLGIDGSHAEVDVRNGYPGAEASYVTVASVMLDVARIKDLDRARPVNPKVFSKTLQAESIDCALPGCNVISEGERSSVGSLRKSIFDVFKTVRMSSDAESLLDTYEVLLSYKPTGQRQECPCDDCLRTDKAYIRGHGEYSCGCENKRTLYSTDALRIHEGMNPAGTNGAMFAEIMQVWERIWVIHILRTLESKKWLSSLRRLAIILDGPLAVFGHPAWLSQAISQELNRINAKVREITGQEILLMGIEKSGAFVQHFIDLDHHGDGAPGKFPRQTAALISDPYIKRNIIFSDSTKPYGEDTYFGRKIFYKTKSGAMIVASLPFLEDFHRDVLGAESPQYPRLSDAMGLLDQLVSSRYPNALTPITSAHAEAAIPLNLGKKVLERLARELIAKDKQ